jgi:hypothetical protein
MPRQRKFWFLVAFAVIAIASGLILIYPSLEKEHIKSRILEHLQQTFDDIPVLAEAQLIHLRYYGCSKCRFAGMMALYATNLPPEVPRANYRNYIENSGWRYDGQWEGQDNSRPIQWGLDAQWPFADTDAQEQSFSFLASASQKTSDLWFTPSEAMRRAKTIGQTVYIIQIVYTLDKTSRARRCPPARGGLCERDWWEINTP